VKSPDEEEESLKDEQVMQKESYSREQVGMEDRQHSPKDGQEAQGCRIRLNDGPETG
jgi:hypothetical protein